jgi:flagellar basal-body rod protein FlgF
MDRLIYTAMTGAKSLLERQATVANNLANMTTSGYRAETSAFRAVPVSGSGLPTREFVLDSITGADFTPGAIQETGRALDVAVQGSGWITVQASDGSEAYTRAGSLRVNAEGTLETHTGLPVLSDSGPISIPPNTTISVGRDGTVSAIPTQPPFNNVSVIGRLKLVNPAESDLSKGLDGLFRVKGGGSADVDDKVALIGGALEGSNVNAAEAMVSMISLARQFEMQMKMLQSADTDAQRATQLLSVNS